MREFFQGSTQAPAIPVVATSGTVTIEKDGKKITLDNPTVIENAIESIAVEVERIREGQRYTSRMLSEGAAMPVSVADRAAGVLQNRGDI